LGRYHKEIRFGKDKPNQCHYIGPVCTAEDIAAIAGKIEGCNTYCVINPSCRTEGFTENVDVTRRLWLPIDVDRASGKRTAPAGSDELEATKAAIFGVNSWWRPMFPNHARPMAGISGNGSYIFLPVDLPNTDEVTEAVVRLYAKLQTEFGSELAKVDPTTTNAARIMRIPGTINWKFPGTPLLTRAVSYGSDGPRMTLDELLAIIPAQQTQIKPQPVARQFCGSLVQVAQSDRVRRAELYAKHMEPAIEGQGGSTATWNAAQAILIGFDLTQDQAYSVLVPWNERCEPPWNESGLRRKIREADTKSSKDRGYILERRTR